MSSKNLANIKIVKTIKILVILAILFLHNVSVSQTPIYLNIVSHNESTDPLDYDGTFVDYQSMKGFVKELCDTIISKRAKYNMQVDANFIFGCLHFDNAANNPIDLLEWANNSPYIDVDGHNHFNPSLGPGYNPYNYADLAYLLDSCGVELKRKILGGATYITTASFNEQWTQYSGPVTGYTFSDFIWQAEILWGSGTPGHVADYNVFGIWKPKGATALTFSVHDPNQTLTFIGGGCKDAIGFNIVPQTGLLRHTTDEIIQNIKDLSDFIQTLPPSENDLYTLNMLMNFRDLPNIPNVADSVARIIDGLQPYADDGKIIWATLAEKYDRWYSAHLNPDDHFIYDCEDVVLSTDWDPSGERITLYPNPAKEYLIIDLNEEKKTRIYILDMTGRVVYQQDFLGRVITIPVNGFHEDLYFIRVQTDKSISIKKFVKQ